jgi:ElaB/YqjD/DUF883 family membrane-anchored ribosome-binding protein
MMAMSGTSMTETNDISRTIERAVGSATNGAHGVVDTATAAAVGHLAAGIHHAVDSVAGTAAHAAESLQATGRQWRDAQGRLTERCGAQVRDRPLTSLAVAAGAGLLLGWLLSRR